MLKRNYALGNDGCMVHTETPLLEGWENCGSLKQLQTFVDHPVRDDLKPDITWKGSKLPADMLKRVLGTAHEFPNMETGYILYYNVTDSTWLVQCPEQRGSGGAVRFKGHDTPPGYSEIGTIHTHPNMNAFWSGTDLADQRGKYGLHIVFGLHNGLADQSLCTIFTMAGEYTKDLDEVCEHVDRTVVYDPDPEWLETIRKQTYVVEQPKSNGGDYQSNFEYVPGLHAALFSEPDNPSLRVFDRLSEAQPKSGQAEGEQFRETLRHMRELERKSRILDDLVETLFMGMEPSDIKEHLADMFSDEMLLIDTSVADQGPGALAEELQPVLDVLSTVWPAPEDEEGGYDSSLDVAMADFGYLPDSLPDWPIPDQHMFALGETYVDESKRRAQLEAMARDFVLRWIRRYGVPQEVQEVQEGQAKNKKGLCARLLDQWRNNA